MKYGLLTLLITWLTYSTSFADADVDINVDGPQSWQVLVNFSALRQTESGRPLYRWLREEVLDEIEDDLDLDAGTDIDELWAHGVEDGFVASVDGPLATTLRERIEEAFDRNDGGLQRIDQAGTEVYALTGETLGRIMAREIMGRVTIDHDSDDSLELAFTSDDRAVFSTTQGLAGRTAADMGGQPTIRSDTFLQVSTDRASAQRTSGGRVSGPWDSSVFQQVDGLSLVLSDGGSDMSLSLELQSDSSQSATAIQNVLQGLLGLYTLSGDTDPDLDRLVRGLSIRSDNAVVRITNQIDPNDLLELID